MYLGTGPDEYDASDLSRTAGSRSLSASSWPPPWGRDRRLASAEPLVPDDLFQDRDAACRVGEPSYVGRDSSCPGAIGLVGEYALECEAELTHRRRTPRERNSCSDPDGLEAEIALWTEGDPLRYDEAIREPLSPRPVGG
jgi:hypothetical protein